MLTRGRQPLIFMLASQQYDGSEMSAQNKIFQFRVALKGITPTIWRRIQVSGKYSFWDLHVAIQDSMGWLDYHLHMFVIKNPKNGQVEKIGIPDDDPFAYEFPVLPGWEISISEYYEKIGDSAEYEYDFGDEWKHEVVLEKILARGKGIKLPKCLAGERTCPPEDCGGTWGYERLLKTISDSSDDEYQSMIEWLGGEYDPDYFDEKKVRFDDPIKRWKRAFT